MCSIRGEKIVAVYLVLGVLAVTLLATVSRAIAFDPEVAKLGVVRVVAEGGHGTGFVVNEDGHVVTNHHVVVEVLQEGGELGVMPTGSSTWYQAEIVHADQGLDLAVLHAPGLGLPPLVLSTGELKDAQTVWSVGFPGAADDLNPQNNATIQQGIVSGLLQGNWEEGDERFPIIQHGATVSPGNSGGPLLDDCSRVIGVNTWASLESVVDEMGNPIRIGDGSNIFWSSGIAETVRILERFSVPFQAEDSTCVVAGGEARELRKEMQKQNLRMIVILLMGGLALIVVLVFLLKKMRQKVFALVKELSQSMRTQKGKERSWLSTSRRKAKRGLVVSGFDGRGNRIRIVLDSDHLANQRLGVSFGRDPALVDEVINDPSMSSRHLRISSAHGGKIYVEDLNSKNGTILDGRKLQPFQAEQVEYNSVLTAGDAELTLSKR